VQAHWVATTMQRHLCITWRRRARMPMDLLGPRTHVGLGRGLEGAEPKGGPAKATTVAL